MKDRVSRYPGRVKLTPVVGQENVYDMVLADEPTEAGTKLNKTALLKDTTAALFGLGTDAVPDEVFKSILFGRKAYRKINSFTNVESGSNSSVIDYVFVDFQNMDYAKDYLIGVIPFADSENYRVISLCITGADVNGNLSSNPNNFKTILLDPIYPSIRTSTGNLIGGSASAINLLVGAETLIEVCKLREETNFRLWFTSREGYKVGVCIDESDKVKIGISAKPLTGSITFSVNVYESV